MNAPQTQPTHSLEIRPFQRRDLSAARALTFYNYHVHNHLDWQTTDEYLRSEQGFIWVAYQGHTLIGILGLSDIVDTSCWVRLAAAEDSTNPIQLLTALWQQASLSIQQQGVRTVAALLMRDWFRDWIQPIGFHHVEDIITLRRYRTSSPPTPPQTHLQIRPIERGDVEQVMRIDHAAFGHMWRMSRSETWQALRVGAYNTLVIDGRHPVGYQIATTHGLNGHLARLAVVPELQGRGVGGVLVNDMLRWFAQRRVNTITVNTQASNIRSQRLYERNDFQRNGYDLPVWTINLE